MIKFINNKKENDNLYSFLKWSKEESKKETKDYFFYDWINDD